MAVATNALIDRGLANAWVKVPDDVDQCRRNGHNISQLLLDRHRFDIQCRECWYTYTVDYGASFVFEDAMKNPIEWVAPKTTTIPVPAGGGLSVAQITEIAAAAAVAAVRAYMDGATAPPPKAKVPESEEAATPEQEAADQGEHATLNLEAARAAKAQRRAEGHVLT